MGKIIIVSEYLIYLAQPRPQRTNNRISCIKQSHIVHQIIATLLRQTLAILLRRQSRATPCGRELACEYRPGRPGFKSSLLRREDLGERWSPFFNGKEGDGG